MARKSTSPTATIITIAAVFAVTVWTFLVASGALNAFDRATVFPGWGRDSAAAQIAAAVAILTWPGVLYIGLLIVAIWSSQRRMRNLAWALIASVALGWGATIAIKFLLRRPRPEQALEVITSTGWAYPSSHMVAITTTAIMVMAATTVTRRELPVRRWVALGMGAAVLLVAADRWLMNAHWLSDLIGGILLGGLTSALALIIAQVTVLPEDALDRVTLGRKAKEVAAAVTDADPDRAPKRCAIIYNPTKVLDLSTFRRHVIYELTERGWDAPLWLETNANDPGHQMAKTAIEEKVDLVLGAGGDGTIRVICEDLAHSGIPFGIIPAGTGNLLARNLNIPLDEPTALQVAFEGTPSDIDLVALTVDGDDRQDADKTFVFAVMAGLGVDAAIMDGTDADLKKTVGAAAYFIAAAQNANRPPLPVTISVDDQPPIQRKAAVILIGNVGIVSGGIQLMPAARADDGQIDVLVAHPRTPGDWARVVTKVLARQRSDDARLDRMHGRKVTLTAARPDHFQLDGDTEGQCSRMVAEVMPGALKVMLPK